jgi:hypothetical protein
MVKAMEMANARPRRRPMRRLVRSFMVGLLVDDAP